ncbi:acyl-CoA synthetase (AMP-forming)/AMP-acid ligase II [Kitasatospora sp. MAP12-15]|uniref:fatty acyl-AMP ligase n=1 Tax=unclassified Kitasatospora TaxID=2633591 RepID=UPI002473294E|nr:fatty acyl-AMP ligase [Kitasatospora sp. MAP12-44]MDH6113780.1 acyl-CoA synthetase (AMP-forming)/AMP-acid ligase II [Kitasatospora sp. MAP12-44]
MSETIVDRIASHARELSTKAAVVFAQTRAGGLASEQLTYHQLDQHARAFAQFLAGHCAPGDRVLLLYPAGLDFVTALIGCQYAGVVAVPAPVPDSSGRRDTRTGGIARDAGAVLVLTDTRRHAEVGEFLRAEGLGELAVLATDELDLGEDAAARWTPPALAADSIAVLQYTSGSTSEPKGVVVSHGALRHNVGLISRSFGAGEQTKVCSWLPHYHDMGLVGTLLAPLALGGEIVLLSPTDFLRRPRLWLELIQQYRSSFTTAPNFAYDLLTRTVTDEQLAALDLSSLRFALNGSEPVDSGTLLRFAERFAPAGFSPEAFKPCYGMAEATLFITGTPPEHGPVFTRVEAEALQAHRFAPTADEGGQLLVSSGPPTDLEVVVVDADTAEVLPEGAVGEIWVRGESVSQGYWQRPEENARAFGARTADGQDGYLRTGDLGVLHEGELYVTGRLKDVLIVRGRNLYPHDIERLVQSMHPGFQGLQGSVCAVPSTQEEIVVMQEVRPHRGEPVDLPELSRRIRTELAERLGVRVSNLVFLRPGQVRRTTSGKVRRSVMRELFLSDGLTAVHQDLDAEIVRRYRSAPEPVLEPVLEGANS